MVRPRLADAKFFYDHDRQTPLAAKTQRTERIVFQEKLGTLAAKTQRQLTSIPASLSPSAPVWSPDGQWIYFVHGADATEKMDIWRIQQVPLN